MHSSPVQNNEGVLGFTPKILVQTTPLLIPELKKITHIATGSNHALALDANGAIYAWGSGQQNQLGRRVVERTRLNGLVPRLLTVRNSKFKSIACGAYHSFGVDTRGKVLAWGLNNYGETGVTEGAGDMGAVIMAPTQVTALKGYDITTIKGGAHHSLAVTKNQECLVWGRVDGFQCGIKITDLKKEDVIFDERKNPRILKQPTAIPGAFSLLSSRINFVTRNTDEVLV
jgi:regulator of chromosome condensation